MFEERVDTKQSKGFFSDFVTGLKIVTFPFWRPLVASTLAVTGHAKKMESFYKYQKEGGLGYGYTFHLVLFLLFPFGLRLLSRLRRVP